MEPIYLVIAIVGLFACLLVWFLTRAKLNNKIQLLEERAVHETRRNELLQQEFEQERALLNEARANREELSQELAVNRSEFKNLRLRYDEYVNDTNRLQERFENLANKIMEEKTQKFDEQHRKGMREILDPLKEKIKIFEEKVERTNKESLERHSSLRTQIKGLTELNERMSKDAINLTKALKGDTKKQGNWGELILESILDKSGLEKDREYFVQRSMVNEDGKRYQPDVIIELPDRKKMIIDSKVSLVAYDRFVNAEDEEDSLSALKAHTLSVKKHIDDLSGKKYQDLYQVDGLDFVLMFIPIDTAFSSALSNNGELYNYAFERNIVIVTPSTLLATLKTVDTMWRNEKQNRYAIEIANEAGKMYDKLANLVNDLEKVGKQLNTVKNTYDDSMKKLVTGSGNLISKSEKLKKLGAKASKQISSAWVERADESV